MSPSENSGESSIQLKKNSRFMVTRLSLLYLSKYWKFGALGCRAACTKTADKTSTSTWKIKKNNNLIELTI